MSLELYQSPTHAIPYVEVSRGREKVLAPLDMGSAVTMVDAMWLAEHPEWSGPDDTLAPVRIGGVDFDAAPIDVVDLTELNAVAEWPSPIILGMSHLGQARWSLDFPRHAWTVER